MPTAGLTRRTFHCPLQKWFLFEVEQPLSAPSHALCPTCGAVAERDFSAWGENGMPPTNLGWRGTHGYATTEDARIAQYQFEHL